MTEARRALVPAVALCGLLLLVVPGCVSSEPLRLAVAPISLADLFPRPPAPFRSEEPRSFITTTPMLEVTLLADAGVPVVVISYPRPAPQLGDTDGRTVLLLGGADDSGRNARPEAIRRFLELDRRRAGRGGSGPFEIDVLLVTHTVGSGLDGLAGLVARPDVQLRQLAHTGIGARQTGGGLTLGERAVVDTGDGQLRYVLAAGSILGSGDWNARRYLEQPGASPGLSALLASALAEEPPARIERLFAGKPNLETSLPTLGADLPRMDLVLPGRDIWWGEDALATDRGAAMVVDLGYGTFRMLVFGDPGATTGQQLTALQGGRSAWDSTCMVLPEASAASRMAPWAETLDVQVVLAGGSANTAATAAASLVRPGDLHLTGVDSKVHLQLRTDGTVFQVSALPVDGAEPRVLTAWRRCFLPGELEGLRQLAVTGHR